MPFEDLKLIVESYENLMEREEQGNQIALVEWFELQYPQYRKLLNVVSFGENIGPVRMKALKKMGLTPGWPDLMLAVPKIYKGESLVIGHHGANLHPIIKVCPGLFIEMKSLQGRATKTQKGVHEQLRENNYRVEVCHHWGQAKIVIQDYLSLHSLPS